MTIEDVDAAGQMVVVACLADIGSHGIVNTVGCSEAATIGYHRKLVDMGRNVSLLGYAFSGVDILRQADIG